MVLKIGRWKGFKKTRWPWKKQELWDRCEEKVTRIIRKVSYRRCSRVAMIWGQNHWKSIKMIDICSKEALGRKELQIYVEESRMLNRILNLNRWNLWEFGKECNIDYPLIRMITKIGNWNEEQVQERVCVFLYQSLSVYLTLPNVTRGSFLL